MKKALILGLLALLMTTVLVAEDFIEEDYYIWGSRDCLRTGREYAIFNYYFYCMDSKETRVREAAILTQKSNETAPKYIFEGTGENWYYMTGENGKVLSLVSSRQEDGGSVIFQEKTGSHREQWRLIPSAEKDYYYIVNRANSQVIAGKDGRTAKGQELSGRNLTGYKGQLWRLEEVR